MPVRNFSLIISRPVCETWMISFDSTWRSQWRSIEEYFTSPNEGKHSFAVSDVLAAISKWNQWFSKISKGKGKCEAGTPTGTDTYVLKQHPGTHKTIRDLVGQFHGPGDMSGTFQIKSNQMIVLTAKNERFLNLKNWAFCPRGWYEIGYLNSVSCVINLKRDCFAYERKCKMKVVAHTTLIIHWIMEKGVS